MKPRTRREILHDPFSAHEALDRRSLMADIFFDFVAEHSFVKAHPQLRAAAEEIGDKLGDFYQLVGRIRFAIDDAPAKKHRKPR
jgi:hypothetical protein